MASRSSGKMNSPMPVAAMFLELRIQHAQSLKDRRQVVRSLKEKLSHGFNISIAEMDDTPTWQSATLGIAAISPSRDYLSGMMVQLESAAVRIAEGLGAEVIVSWDFLDSGFESGLESDPPH
jgi:uncharacterized protein YlxP (DUF503 family)